MARIRTIKPELFVSESLASVPLTSERTFVGLLTQADDQGRHRDHAAIIAGALWALRPEHTPLHVEEDLQHLAEAGLICRYAGCDGRMYLHMVSFARHQRIDRPSRSRLPACPRHQGQGRCAGCDAMPCTAAAASTGTPPREQAGDSSGPPRALDEGWHNDQRGFAAGSPPAQQSAARALVPDEAAGNGAGQVGDAGDSSRARRGLGEGSGGGGELAACGSRTVDQGSGSVPPGGASQASAVSPVSARELVAEYVAGCSVRPPQRVVGQVGREVSALLAEGVDPGAVRAGLERLRARPMHPSVLASLVNQELNGGFARPGSAVTVPVHRGWTNPQDRDAYGEEL